MRHFGKHYIDGQWIAPQIIGERPLIDPTTEAAWASVATGGSVADVDLAVMAARRAFARFSRSSVADRMALIDRIIAAVSVGLIARAARSAITVWNRLEVVFPAGILSKAAAVLLTLA